MAMRMHAQVADVQQFGCYALASMCSGKDALVAARAQQVVAAGAIEVVVAAMQTHARQGHRADDGASYCLLACALVHIRSTTPSGSASGGSFRRK